LGLSGPAKVGPDTKRQIPTEKPSPSEKTD
jgi:hypothetical protein